MNRVLANPEVAAIAVDLTLPVTKIGVGPFAFDPLAHLIGVPLEHLLSSLMTGPIRRRASLSGPAVEVYPLALPNGEGASIPLGQWGEFGFQNREGLLVLTVPLPAARWVTHHLGTAIVEGPDPALSVDGTARVVRYGVSVSAGMKARFPLGAMGEVGIEVG